MRPLVQIQLAPPARRPPVDTTGGLRRPRRGGSGPKPLRRPVRITSGPLRPKALEIQDGPDRHGDAGAHDEDGRAGCVRAADEPHNGSCRPHHAATTNGRRGTAVCPGQEPALRHDVPLRAGCLRSAAPLRTGRGTGCRPALKRRGRTGRLLRVGRWMGGHGEGPAALRAAGPVACRAVLYASSPGLGGAERHGMRCPQGVQRWSGRRWPVRGPAGAVASSAQSGSAGAAAESANGC